MTKRPFLSNLCKINIKTESCLFDLCNPSWHFKIFLHSTFLLLPPNSTKFLSLFPDTGIGKVVKQLTSSEDKAIAKAARVVKTRWQNIVERRVELSLKEDKPDVQSDLETRRKRDKALELLCQAYPSLSPEILTKVEKKFFNHFRPCIGSNYRRAIRKVVIQRSKFEKILEEEDLQFLLEKATRWGGNLKAE